MVIPNKATTPPIGKTFAISFYEYISGARIKVTVRAVGTDYREALKEVRADHPDADFEGATVRET